MESNISELGHEQLVDIFCRLGSYKYAIQCKFVCKLWCSIINNSRSSDSYFLRRWHQINGKEGKLSVVLLAKHKFHGKPTLDSYGTFESRLVLGYRSPNDRNTNKLLTLGLDFLPHSNTFGDRIYIILSSCKDLVLCRPDHYDHSRYYLCNPFTKQWTALPPPPPFPAEGDMIYSTSAWLSVYDEGDSPGSRFAVARVVSYHPRFQDVHILVFSSDGSHDGWRKIDCSDGLDRSGELCNNVVSYNGDFVRITIPYGTGTEFTGFRLNPYLAYTSVYQPELLDGPVSCSPSHMPNLRTSIIGVSQGHLRLAELDNYRRKLIVWQLNHGPKQSLEKVQELDFNELVDSEDLPIARACYRHENGTFGTSLLAFHPHEGDILYLFFTRPEKTVASHTFSCNLTKKRLELIREVPEYIMKDNFVSLVLSCWPTSVPQLH